MSILRQTVFPGRSGCPRAPAGAAARPPVGRPTLRHGGARGRIRATRADAARARARSWPSAGARPLQRRGRSPAPRRAGPVRLVPRGSKPSATACPQGCCATDRGDLRSEWRRWWGSHSPRSPEAGGRHAPGPASPPDASAVRRRGLGLRRTEPPRPPACRAAEGRNGGGLSPGRRRAAWVRSSGRPCSSSRSGSLPRCHGRESRRHEREGRTRAAGISVTGGAISGRGRGRSGLQPDPFQARTDAIHGFAAIRPRRAPR